jgi:hypothetical protein
VTGVELDVAVVVTTTVGLPTVIVKFWLLTDTDCVAVTLCQVAVIVSLPLLTAVIENVAVPVEPVVTDPGVNVLPSADVSATV